MAADIAESGVAAEELRQIIERAERLTEERQALGDDLKEVFAEARGRGFCTKTIKRVMKIRKQDHAERQEEEAMLDLYLQGLGMS